MIVEVISCTRYPEDVIERAGKTCYKSYENVSATSKETFIKNIIKRGHESVLEHASVTFNVKGVSRSLTHQLVRHRAFSFSQESQRYVKQNNFDYITPKSVIDNCISDDDTNTYQDLMIEIQKVYDHLINLGIPPEDARFILPNACCTEITFTCDFRNLRNFLKLRLDKHSQWEIRILANNMLELMIKEAPNVFGDLK